MIPSTKDVEFRLDGRPYVPVHINGRGPFWLLFDTGSIGSRITPEVAENLGREERIENDILNIEELRIGEAKWENIGLGVYDESETEKLLGKSFDGFLGNGFLWSVCEQFSLMIDYPNRALSFEPRDGRHTTDNQIAISMENYYAVVPVEVQGEGIYRFLLDTGASKCAVSPDIAELLGLPLDEHRPARDMAADLDAYGSKVARLSVGSTSLSNVPISVMDCSLASSYVCGVIDGYLASVRSFKPGNKTQDCCLTASTWTEQGHDFSGVDI